MASVYNELAKSLGDEVSSRQLLQAANELIRISKGEYTDKVLQERAGRPQYHSQEVDAAFEKNQWLLVAAEFAQLADEEKEELSPEELARYRVLSLGLNDSQWEF